MIILKFGDIQLESDLHFEDADHLNKHCEDKYGFRPTLAVQYDYQQQPEEQAIFLISPYNWDYRMNYRTREIELLDRGKCSKFLSEIEIDVPLIYKIALIIQFRDWISTNAEIELLKLASKMASFGAEAEKRLNGPRDFRVRDSIDNARLTKKTGENILTARMGVKYGGTMFFRVIHHKEKLMSEDYDKLYKEKYGDVTWKDLDKMILDQLDTKKLTR